MTTFYWTMEYLATCVELFMCCIFCGTFLVKGKIAERKYFALLLSMLGAFIACVLNRIEMFSYINSFIVMGIMVLFQWLIYRGRVLRSIIFTLIYMAILTATDFFSVYTFSSIMHIETEYLLNEQSINRVVTLCFSKLFLVLLTIAIFQISKVRSSLSKKYIAIMGTCSISIFLANLVMVQGHLSNKEMKSILFLVTLGIELFIVYSVCELAENYERQQQIAFVELRNEMLQKSLDDTKQAIELWRTSIHDYKNNIITLTQLSQEGDIKGIREYLEEQNGILDKKIFYIKTGNSVVDAIINTKKNMAEQKNMVFNVNAIIPKDCKIKAFDIANILGNLIDNAMEACVLEKKPYIDISVKEEKKFLMIKVSNSFTGQLPKNMQTTKEDKVWHGIGMKSIKNIVEKYSGEYEMLHIEDEVVVNIMLLNKKISKS